MNKGRLSGHSRLARLSLLTAGAFICIWHPVQAQQGNPEVYVDMGVLQGLGGDPDQQQMQPVKLRPPTLRPPASTSPQSRLIAPTQQAPAYVPPVAAQPPAPINAPVVQATLPKPVKASVPAKTYVSKPPEMPADEVRREIVAKVSTPEPLKSAPPPPVPAAILKPVPMIAVSEPTPIVPEAKPTIQPVPVATIEEEPKPATVSEAVAFPVKTKTRAETSDPSGANTSRPVPVRSGIAGNLKDVVPSRPAPDFDPAAEVASKPAEPVRDLTEESAAVVKQVKSPAKITEAKPPVIPGRKPKIETKIVEEKKEPEVVAQSEVQKAPPELVAELRAREESKKSGQVELKKAAIDLADPPPPPGPRGKKNMPAVAKPKVDSEPLAEQTIKLAANDDPLLGSLVEKDKSSLVATIESMVAAREDGKALPVNEKPKRELGSNIVKSEPMQRPYNVYRPGKSDEVTPAVPIDTTQERVDAVVDEKQSAKKPEDIKVASLPETAPVAPRPPAPRSEDEQAYVSVPFTEGLTEIDAKITSEIETRLLPVLNDNPGWKLQIQAFASPIKDGVSSARKASLERAMSVRTYLLSKGIEATRMDIRALGSESDRDPMDRVDLIVFDPAKKG